MTAPPTSNTGRCVRCDASLSDGTPDGLCTRCLLAAALAMPADEEETAGSAVETPAALLRRREFAGYELLDEIAHGGMGVVFRARQKRPDRLVALKVIGMGELASPRVVERFRTEAEAAARLEHPNIVPIHEVGQDGPWHFFSMRLIEGPTLGQVLAEKPMSPESAARLMVQIARAVHHAHQRGVLHRDLKPNNILLDAEGQPHLTDFGLAKMLESDGGLTHTRAVLGTPAYMSPEQAGGGARDVTVAADVYGLGAVLYEMLAGRPPFSGSSPAALLRRIVEAEPEPPLALRGRRKSEIRNLKSEDRNADAGTPGVRASDFGSRFSELDIICLKCLEKNPAQRYATAAELADDLERWLRHEPIQARATGFWERGLKWTRRHPARAGLWASMVLSGFLLTIVSLAFNFRLERARKEAEANAASARQQLVRHHLSEASRLLDEGDAFFGAVWAAQALREAEQNGRARQQALDRLQLTFQFAPRLMRLWLATDIPTGTAFDATNQTLIVNLRNEKIQAWRLESLAPVTAVSFPPGAAKSDSPAWLPNDERSGSQALSPDRSLFASVGLDNAVRLRRMGDGRIAAPLLRHEARVRAMAFSPEGRFLATASADRLVRVWDLAQPIWQASQFHLPVTRPAFSSDGRAFLAMESAGSFRVCDAHTGESLSPMLEAGGNLIVAAFNSPNRHFATATDAGRVRVWESGANRLIAELQTEGPFLSMEFNPSGDKLAMVNSRGNGWLWRWSNTNEPARTFFSGGLTRRVEWHPNGTWLLTVGEVGLRLWSAETLAPVSAPFLRDEAGYTARFSPDGKLLVASFRRLGDEPASAQVCEVPSLRPVGPPLGHGDGLRDVRFTPDGRFVVTCGADQAIRVWNATNGQPVVPAMRHPLPVRNTVFSSDARWLVSCGEGGIVRFWELATGECLAPPLLLSRDVFEANLSGSNRSLIVRSQPDLGWFLPLEFTSRVDADWAQLAVLSSGHRHDTAGGLSGVPAEELVELFADARARQPGDYVWPADFTSWHEQQAALAHKAEDWSAVVFHLRQLVRLRPRNEHAADRLREAEKHLTR